MIYFQKKKVRQEEIDELLNLLEKWRVSESINKQYIFFNFVIIEFIKQLSFSFRLNDYFDCSFLYFHQKLLMLYFRRIMSQLDEGRALYVPTNFVHEKFIN